MNNFLRNFSYFQCNIYLNEYICYTWSKKPSILLSLSLLQKNKKLLRSFIIHYRVMKIHGNGWRCNLGHYTTFLNQLYRYFSIHRISYLQSSLSKLSTLSSFSLSVNPPLFSFFFPFFLYKRPLNWHSTLLL